MLLFLVDGINLPLMQRFSQEELLNFEVTKVY